MTQENEDQVFDPDDEMADIEAADPPEGPVESDPYVDDPAYDESLSELDPDEQGLELPHSEEEWRDR